MLHTPQKMPAAQSAANAALSPSLDEKTEARQTKLRHQVQEEIDNLYESSQEPDQDLKTLFKGLVHGDRGIKLLIRDTIERKKDTPYARKHLSRTLSYI